MDFDAVAYLNDPAWFSSRYGLDRMRDLMKRLGNPQKRLCFVHVAGTNGKGSTCAYLDAILRAAGYRTGLYTSPYIETFEERIRVNGENISMEDLTRLTLQVREAAEAMVAAAAAVGDPAPAEAHPTAFELMTAVAFLYYAEQDCEIVVLEVGLGGLLDATNIIDASEVAIITRLGLEHTEILGNTLAEIAENKAGIIKLGSAVVSWPQEPEAMEVIERTVEWANEELSEAVEFQLDHTKLYVPDFDALVLHPVVWDDGAPYRPFAYKGVEYRTPLLAAYQPANATLAIEAVPALRRFGWDISDEAVCEGIAVCAWPGRFEVFATEPLTIVDGSHNPQGIAALAETLRDVLPCARPVFMLGILADKDYRQMVGTLAPYGSAFYCVTPPTPRALPAAALAAVLRETLGEAAVDVEIVACESFDEAAERACAKAAAQAATTSAAAAAAPAAAVAVQPAAPAFAGSPVCIVATGSLYSIGCEKPALRAALNFG